MRILKSLVVTALQLGLYVILLLVLTDCILFAARRLGDQHVVAQLEGYGRLVLPLTASVFAVVYLAVNLIRALVGSRLITMLLTVAAVVAVTTYMWSTFGHRPYRAGTIIFSGLVPMLHWFQYGIKPLAETPIEETSREREQT